MSENRVLGDERIRARKLEHIRRQLEHIDKYLARVDRESDDRELVDVTPMRDEVTRLLSSLDDA